MKNVFISTIITAVAVIALMVISHGLYAQEEKKAQGEPEVKWELVWKQEFEEEIINVAFSDEKTIVITENEIYSLDNINGDIKYLRSTYQGEKIPKWRRTWVYPSQNGKYIGIYHNALFYDQDGEYDTHRRFAIVELIDNTGKNLWLREKEISVEAPYFLPTLVVSNQGYSVETDLDCNGKLYFYDLSGQIVKEVKISENYFEEYVTHGETWSDDGEYFAIFTDEGIKDDENYVSYVILYTKEGNIMWRHQQNEFSTSYHNNIAISPSNKYVSILTRGNYIDIFDLQGSRLLKQNISKSHYNQIIFSEDGEEITVYSNIGVVSNFIIPSEKLNWQENYLNSEITSLQRIGKGKIFIIGSRNRLHKTSVISFVDGKDRKILNSIDFDEAGRGIDSLNKIGCPLINILITKYKNLLVVLPHKCLSYHVILSQRR